jgi:hypothetical protein
MTAMFNLKKYTDKFLKKDKNNQQLRKYTIDPSALGFNDVDSKELQHQQYLKLIEKARVCLRNQHHFWLQKNGQDYRVTLIEKEIKFVIQLATQIENKVYPQHQIEKLKEILSKYSG